MYVADDRLVYIQVLDDCVANASFTAFLENHHCSHDCEAQQLRSLLHAPVTRVSCYLISSTPRLIYYEYTMNFFALYS